MKYKKILFASMPLEGHFNPLTSLAMHLRDVGHDVRWYTGRIFGPKLAALGIPHYPFQKALELNQFNMEEVLPQRKNLKNEISKLKFDIRNSFIFRATEFYEDVLALNDQFDFDVLICDITFTGAPFIKDKMNKPVIAIGVLPIAETSRDLAPNGLAISPSPTFMGRKRQDLLRFIADKVLFNSENKLIGHIFNQYGMKGSDGNVFDHLYRKSDLVLQSGSPGFEYHRSDLNPNIRFIGAVLPYSNRQPASFRLDERLKSYEKVILVTQGTVEKDTGKLIEPTLKAFAGSRYLVIATTGGSNTLELKQKYSFANIVVEDFIPFREVMPHADVFITNGGYGGVMLGIEHGLPLVVSGVHEGKNEINARVGYFKIGLNLKTETPSPLQIMKNVEVVLKNPVYKTNVKKLGEEMSAYNPNLLCEQYLEELLAKGNQHHYSFIHDQKVA
jgi:UDP:flavonoid glycosyltransferase YjiC (YdhE family)